MATDQAVPPPISRRAVVATVVRTLLSSAGLVWLYFVIPLTGRTSAASGVLLVVGLAAFLALLTWQVRSVMRADQPRLRALEVLGTAVPFFLLLFAATYFLLARNDQTAFSQQLSRLDALYFTVTVFATVGFGDIVARSETARSIVTVQMVGDLVLIGLGVRLLLGAVQVGLTRRTQDEPLQHRGATRH